MLIEIKKSQIKKREKYYQKIREHMLLHRSDFANMDLNCKTYMEYISKYREPELFFISLDSNKKLLGIFTANFTKGIISGLTVVNISNSLLFSLDLFRFAKKLKDKNPKYAILDILENNRVAFNVAYKMSRKLGYKLQVYNRMYTNLGYLRSYRISKLEDWEMEE
jgi:hypothetical protein